MIIKNKKFSTNARVHNNFFSQLKGLMFSKKLKPNQSILLKFKKEKIMPIHMFFVFQSIDAVWINSKNIIVHIERNIKPFTPLITPNLPATSILETSNNATKNLKLKDKLFFK
jgi:uncharacterized membrane protein (UPF0127 family)